MQLGPVSADLDDERPHVGNGSGERKWEVDRRELFSLSDVTRAE